MKNLLKVTFAALTLSLVMMLSPTQINATYMPSGPSCEATFGASCECVSGQSCRAGLFRCRCKGDRHR